MSRFISYLLFVSVVLATAAGTTACRKKIYLEQPEIKEGEERQRDEGAEATEKRLPYVVDEEVQDSGEQF